MWCRCGRRRSISTQWQSRWSIAVKSLARTNDCFMNAHGSRACRCLTRARAFAAKLKEAHALLEAERIEAFSTADQEPPADRATFQNPLGTDGGEDADEEAAEDENGLSKT